jgi:hypothetical protein
MTGKVDMSIYKSDRPVDESHIPSDVKYSICEALDCNAKATVEVYVRAGHYGLIALSLCNNCINKFKIEGQVGPVTTPANQSTSRQASSNQAAENLQCTLHQT